MNEMEKALRKYNEAFDQLFSHCLSNGIYNQWGASFDCTTLNEAKLLADRALRPTAPVEGLETVGYVTTSPTGAEGFQRKPLVPGHGQFGYKQDAVVTRSRAEELLAAERAETMRQVKHWSELYKQQHYRAEKAEAIIAAVTAQRDALIEAGLKCCNGTPNPELPRFDLALSFINSTNEARKAADIVWQDLKAENAALTAKISVGDDRIRNLKLENETLTARVNELVKNQTRGTNE